MFIVGIYITVVRLRTNAFFRIAFISRKNKLAHTSFTNKFFQSHEMEWKWSENGKRESLSDDSCN